MSRKKKYSKKIVGGYNLDSISKKINTLKDESEKKKYFEAIKLAIDALEQTDVNKGLFDAFYKSFEPTDIGKKRKDQIENAENHDKLKILYFPSESNFVGKRGKVVKKNTYGDYAIVSSKPNTTFTTMLAKNFRSTEDFIAQLLQGREGPVKRKPIFEEDILITDRSFKNELAKNHMKEKIQEITDVFDTFINKFIDNKFIDNKFKNNKVVFETYFSDNSTVNDVDFKKKLIGLQPNQFDSDYKTDLKKLYEFRKEIKDNLMKSDYTIASNTLYSNDIIIKDLREKLEM